MAEGRSLSAPALCGFWPEFTPSRWRHLRMALLAGLTDPTLEDVLRRVAGLLVACATKKTEIPLDDPSRLPGWLVAQLGLAPDAARALAGQLSVLPPPLKTAGEPLPEALDLAGLLVDRLAPRAERKALGLFVTAAPVADQMAGLLLDAQTRIPRLLDNATGTATLPLAVLRRLLAMQPSPVAVLTGLRQGWRLVEKHPLLAAMASLQLIMAGWPHWTAGSYGWPVHCGDGLAPQGELFTHAIGNPPYRGEKQADGELATLQKQYPDLKDAYQGKADVSFFFILRLLRSLEKGGRLILLTPASWTTADGAGRLREQIRLLAGDIRLHRPCAPLPSVRSLDLTVLDARRGEPPPELAHAGGLFHAVSGPLEGFLGHMETLPGRFGGKLGPLRIHCGIQTGADRISGSACFILGPPEAEALLPVLSEAERCLLKPLVKSPALGPYILDGAESGFLIYLDGTRPIDDFPRIGALLEPFREMLSRRREVRQGKIPWWRLHWPRQAEIFESPSLLIPQRASFPRAAIAPAGAYSSVDVYHALPAAGSPLDLFGWAALFHALPVALWLAFRGKRKGKLVELYHTPLANIPLPPTLCPAICGQLNTLGAGIHAAMAALARHEARQAAWYLDWESFCLRRSPGVQDIQDGLREVDRLAAQLLGLDAGGIEPLRGALAETLGRRMI